MRMYNWAFYFLIMVSSMLLPLSAEAISVSPRGVNVRTFGATTVFLTFLGLTDNQRPAEALWCGEINADQSCVPDTVFGRFPLRSDLSTESGANNFTDIMTIPPSVARRAYQAALRGNSSEFFYVRRFINATGGPDEFVAVTCRLAGGGARVPLALTNVRLEFTTQETVQAIAQGQLPPSFHAKLRYNGTGRLKGRWEVVLPGDPQPTEQDLLTEATLPVELRGRQRRYTLVETFDRFLPPTGEFTLPGPDPTKLPQNTTGLHLVLLRIEATNDREGNSFTNLGTIHSGGVAGFPLPVLRYFVRANTSNASSLLRPLELVTPIPNAQLSARQLLTFRWQSVNQAQAYKLEVVEAKTEQIVLSALLNQETRYVAPPWLQKYAGQGLKWRVLAIAQRDVVILRSNWRNFQLQP